MKTYISVPSKFKEDINMIPGYFRDYLNLQKRQLIKNRDININTVTPVFRSMWLSDDKYQEYHYTLMYENIIIYEE